MINPPFCYLTCAIHLIMIANLSVIIRLQVRNNEAFSGVMFVKNKYDTCRVEVTESESATLLIGLPSNFGAKLVNGEETSSTMTSSTTDEETTAGNKLSKPVGDLRIKRQASDLQRDCGIQDMVCLQNVRWNIYNDELGWDEINGRTH